MGSPGVFRDDNANSNFWAKCHIVVEASGDMDYLRNWMMAKKGMRLDRAGDKTFEMFESWRQQSFIDFEAVGLDADFQMVRLAEQMLIELLVELLSSFF